MTEKQKVMAYIGRRPTCGHVVFACVDDTKHAARTARNVASAVRDGLEVTRVTLEEARSGADWGWCPEECPSAPKRKKATRPPDDTRNHSFSLFTDPIR